MSLSLSKYRKYCLKIKSFISTSFNQPTKYNLYGNGLNNAKKALINGKMCNILDVINLTEETNFDLIKKVPHGLIS